MEIIGTALPIESTAYYSAQNKLIFAKVVVEEKITLTESRRYIFLIPSFPESLQLGHLMTESATMLSHEDYTVGWICALPLEMTAAKAMLDETHSNLSQPATMITPTLLAKSVAIMW